MTIGDSTYGTLGPQRGENGRMTLTKFLLARIAEDEVVAKAASPGPWHVNEESATVLAVDEIEVCDGFALSGPQLRATTAHIARHDPARVLAECEAKRRIVELHSYPKAWCGWTQDPNDGHDEENLCDTLKTLALPYAEHPDFDEEWKP